MVTLTPDTQLLVSVRSDMDEEFNSYKAHATLWNIIHHRLVEGGVMCTVQQPTGTEPMEEPKTKMFMS